MRRDLYGRLCGFGALLRPNHLTAGEVHDLHRRKLMSREVSLFICIDIMLGGIAAL